MFKIVSNIMSGNTVKRLKSVVTVPKKNVTSNVIYEKFHYSQELLKLKTFSELKRKFHVNLLVKCCCSINSMEIYLFRSQQIRLKITKIRDMRNTQVIRMIGHRKNRYHDTLIFDLWV